MLYWNILTILDTLLEYSDIFGYFAGIFSAIFVIFNHPNLKLFTTSLFLKLQSRKGTKINKNLIINNFFYFLKLNLTVSVPLAENAHCCWMYKSFFIPIQKILIKSKNGFLNPIQKILIKSKNGFLNHSLLSLPSNFQFVAASRRKSWILNFATLSLLAELSHLQNLSSPT